jgi:hypothetical protein
VNTRLITTSAAALLLLLTACTSVPDYAPLPEAGQEQRTGSSSMPLPNRLASRGALLALPAGWFMTRAGTWMPADEAAATSGGSIGEGVAALLGWPGGDPSALRGESPGLLPEEQEIDGGPVVFVSPDERYLGVFRTAMTAGPVDPQQYITYYTETLVPPQAPLELQKPQPQAGRSCYLLRWVHSAGVAETAFWFGRREEEGIDRSAVYVLALLYPRIKAAGEERVPEISGEALRMRRAILSAVEERPEDLEMRVLPGRVRFLSSSAWRWLTDFGDGLILAGTVSGRQASAVIHPVEPEMGPDAVLAYLSGAPQPEAERFDLRLLADNGGYDADGAGRYLPGGGLQIGYVLPAALAGGPWGFGLLIGGERRAAAGSGNQDEVLPALSAVHRLPEVAALLQRQLFFQLEAEP